MATLASVESKPNYVPGEWEARVDLAAAYRLVALYGWDDLIFTHLSARVPGPEHHFLINPYDMMFEEITASSLVKIDVEGNPVGATTHPVNPAGFTIHSALHMAREDANAVMHLHTPHGQAVSAMEFGLLPHTQTSMIAGHDIAYHDYEGIATDLEERERLVADMGDKHAMILRNHGTLAVGDSVGACFLRLYFLERACEAQVLMLSAGKEHLNNPPQGVEDKVARQSAPKGMGMLAERLAWPALLRKLDRIDPSYRE
ncbi:MAG: class II aldolase/adducin family protein [Sphingomonas sp.]|uniref:Class II aldolase/adducin family protein n=1 Tax=Sphingomonas lycopersici TaxID=2951807 RepID=A0AA41Z9P8_9SPHN|nr:MULTISPECIES: class II aldolase/adducin family protein [Sphingomonas]MBV8237208.1 class II aldolase/adducin family protein [Sphingomonas sp.]MCW6535574.1 class II aldolase/adducin family protein [Sphingomonas lycopersici]OJU14721.1 MAG: class II aldolase [Sphingomonas sp. 66-10]